MVSVLSQAKLHFVTCVSLVWSFWDLVQSVSLPPPAAESFGIQGRALNQAIKEPLYLKEMVGEAWGVDRMGC